MADSAVHTQLPTQGKLVNNVIYFARALRRAGISVGPGQIVNAINAVKEVGFERKGDMYWALHACFVTRPEHKQVYTQAFRLFWRDPRYLEHMMSAMLPMVRGVTEERQARDGDRRAAGALLGDQEEQNSNDEGPPEEFEIGFDASNTTSQRETLRSMDFEQMTASEAAEARRIVTRMSLPVKPLASRRRIRSPSGRYPAWKSTMRKAARTGGQVWEFERQRKGSRWPNLVVLCDISGSMSAYSRTLLHFLHSIMHRKGQKWTGVHAFTFGTQLNNITRLLAEKDVDQALGAVGAGVTDWEGGTRIGECLRTFNAEWNRRLLSRGAVVLIITDGLESGDPAILRREAERLQLSSRRVIWINPLLRWNEFAPKAKGIRAMLPFVDCFRSAHNIDSLEELASAVSDTADDGERNRLMQLLPC